MSQEDCVVNVWSHVWLCVWVLQFTGRAEITEGFTYRGRNTKNIHWAEISGALVKAPCPSEIRTQAAQGWRGGCTGRTMCMLSGEHTRLCVR